MTKTQAIRQATEESSLYRIGGQYVVSYYTDQYGCNTETHPRPWAGASQVLGDHRVARALAILGIPAVDADYYASLTRGAVRGRVNAALELISNREPQLLAKAA